MRMENIKQGLATPPKAGPMSYGAQEGMTLFERLQRAGVEKERRYYEEQRRNPLKRFTVKIKASELLANLPTACVTLVDVGRMEVATALHFALSFKPFFLTLKAYDTEEYKQTEGRCKPVKVIEYEEMKYGTEIDLDAFLRSA